MKVADASVVYKWIVDEADESTKGARVLRQKYLSGREKVVVPDILLYEIANIFAYKTKLSKADVEKAWQSFMLLELPIIHATNSFMRDCLDFSQEYKVSIYDAAYIVLAKKKDCVFVTADIKLVKKVGLKYVRFIISDKIYE